MKCFSSGNDKDRLVHWCHGAPGVVHLMLLAHQVWGSDTDKYLVAARRAGELTWQRGLLKKGPGLCHGVSGNGYAFLHLYQVRIIHCFHSLIQLISRLLEKSCGCTEQQCLVSG